jgi:hypothetical protein
VDYTKTQYQPGVDTELDKRIQGYMGIDSTAGSGRWEGGGRTEAQAREQWAQWDQFRDPNCPPDRPFRSERGIPGCFEKPVDTPEGTDPSQFGPGGEMRRGAGGGGGGRGGFGGMSGSAFSGFPGGPGSPEAQTIWGSIMQRLQGGTRFTPQVMDTLLGAQKSQAEGAAGRASAEAEADMARRGLSRSSLAGRAQQQIRTGVGQTMLQATAQLQRAKIDADFQDKTQAIQDGLNWLNSLRSYVSSLNATQAQKEVAMANIQLGYQQLTHQTNTMRENYAQQLQMLGLQS